MHDANGGLDVARLCGKWRQQIAVQANDGLHIGAGARELQNIAAAETEADRNLALEVADFSFRALASQGFERGSDPPPAFGRVGAQCIGKGMASGGPAAILPPPYMSATKATYLLPAMVAARLMALSVTPSQFGAISKSGRGPLARSS